MTQPLTPREAERQVHRRARALAAVRSAGRTAETTVHLRCVEDAGRWHAVITVRVGEAKVVDTSAEGADPTAALLALPGALAEVIESTRAALLNGLREGEDRPDEEPAAVAPTAAQHRPRSPRTGGASPDDGRVLCASCSIAAGGEHLPFCRLKESPR
jgi:hypothetical protein